MARLPHGKLPMSKLYRPSIALLLLVPALFACGPAEQKAAPPKPLDPSALAVVVKDAGVSRQRLARSIDQLFTDEAAGETRALLVMRGGRIIAERYGEGFDRGTRHLGWSMSKSVTGVMIGMLVGDGRLRLDESAPVPAWQRPGDPRGEITLRELLQMRSGLRHIEDAEIPPKADTVRMLLLEGRDDMASYAEAQPLATPPGSKFVYSSATTVILANLAARALTESTDPAVRRQVVGNYLRTRLFDQIGMAGARAEFDAAGTFIGSSMLHATARDWAEFGEFLRNDGMVKGARLVPQGWISFMRAPSPRNPGYGAQIWLNRKQVDGGAGLWPGKAPADIFAAVGHLGQYVVVSPKAGLTMVRLGKSDADQRDALRARLLDVLKAGGGV